MSLLKHLFSKNDIMYLIISNSNIQIIRIYSCIHEFTRFNFEYTYVIILRSKNVMI